MTDNANDDPNKGIRFLAHCLNEMADGKASFTNKGLTVLIADAIDELFDDLEYEDKEKFAWGIQGELQARAMWKHEEQVNGDD